jgi:hypothetical protein
MWGRLREVADWDTCLHAWLTNYITVAEDTGKIANLIIIHNRSVQ